MRLWFSRKRGGATQDVEMLQSNSATKGLRQEGWEDGVFQRRCGEEKRGDRASPAQGCAPSKICAFNFRRYLSFVRPFFRLSDDRL